MSEPLSPAVQRRRLRTELRRARQQTHKTQDEVASALEWSLSKIIRIETGAVGISTTDLMALLRLYDITDTERINQLTVMARAARRPSWWSKYRESVSPRYLQYIEYEENAYIIREFETLLIPGLLQTEEYATALIKALGEDVTDKLVRERLEVRMIRQQLLEQTDLPLAFFILDEAAIRRLVGERDIARDQISRISQLAKQPNITIEIVPFSAGIHRGMIEPFSILEFSDAADSDVLYLESSRDTVLSQDEVGQITEYRETFEVLREISLGPRKSSSYLEALAKEIG